jgi:hypothetical protein
LLQLPHPAAPTATMARAAAAAPTRRAPENLLDCSDMVSLLLPRSMDAEPLLHAL